MSWPCLCRYSYAPVFAECDTGPVFTASSTQTHARGTSVTTDKHKGRTGSAGHTGHKSHTGIDRRHRPALHSAFNGTAHTHTHKGGNDHTGHKRHTGIDRRHRPPLHTAFNGTAHTDTHTHTARPNRIDSSTWTDSSASTGSLRASPRRGHNGTHNRINPRHPRHDVGERLCRRPCQPVVEPLYKRLCQYVGAPAQMPGTPLSLSYTLHDKDDAAHPMDNTTKQMCAAARQMGAAAKASQDPRRRSAGAECGAGA